MMWTMLLIASLWIIPSIISIFTCALVEARSKDHILKRDIHDGLPMLIALGPVSLIMLFIFVAGPAIARFASRKYTSLVRILTHREPEKKEDGRNVQEC